MADQTAVYALYVSIGSLMVSIVSACFARSAQRQAKKAATLTQRREAINHIRNALEDTVARNVETHDRLRTPASERYLNSRSIFETVTSIRRAKNLAEVVFSKDIRNNLDSALQHIENFAEFTEKGVLDRHPDLTLEL